MRRILIFVLGLGCSEIKELDKIEDALKIHYKTPCVVMCNRSIGKTLRNIGKTVCYLPPSKKSRFVNEVFNELMKYAKNDYMVTVVGHSYGGSVVSRVAEILTDKGITRNNIRMITTGSIYVPKPNLTRNVNIRHIMFENDVALRCNHLSPTKDTYVEWLKHKQYRNYKPKRYKVFGSETEWEIHNDYDKILDEIIIPTKNTKLNAAERSLRKLAIHNKLKSYIGGGVDGHVFETSEGNLIKMINGNNPMEYEGLRIMHGSGITPKLKKFHGKEFSGKVYKNIKNRNLQNVFKKYVKNLTIFKMNKINANKVMTMSNYVKKNPKFDWKTERKRLLKIIHSRGLTHGDFHLGNILVSLSKNKPPRFWAIDFGRSVKLPAGISEKSLFKTKYFGPRYGKHGGQTTFLTRSNRIVKPNYEITNMSSEERKHAEGYKYLPDPNYLRKFGVNPYTIEKRKRYYGERYQRNKKPRLFKTPVLRTRHNAPIPKSHMKIENVNLQNYSKIYKQIRIKTNFPGAYQLRKKLLSNLEKRLTVTDYKTGIKFKPYTQRNYYYSKYGKDPKHWIFLLPNSYKIMSLKRDMKNFKHVIK